MQTKTQRARAERFRELHQGPPILVLPNAWDAGSARVFEQAGFPAVATTSAGIARSGFGLPDGQRISREDMLEAVRRIAHAVSVPVTADMEAGYAETPEGVAETARAVLAAGAIGMNLEDSTNEKKLFDVALQVEKIRAVREAAAAAGIPLVLNARTDVFVTHDGEPATRLEHAVHRANAYREAGADCLFVPGVHDAETIAALAQQIHGPLNILASAGTPPPVADLERLGVRRVSVGSGPSRACLALVQRIAKELCEQGTYSSFMENTLSYADVQRMFGGRIPRAKTLRRKDRQRHDS